MSRGKAIVHTRTLMLLSVVALSGSAFAYAPAPREEIENAMVLSEIGPRAHAAFVDAVSNGTITRNEMRIMRRRAVEDLQHQEGTGSR